MSMQDRRSFLRQSSLGLGLLGASGWRLAAGAEPTPASGNAGEYDRLLAQAEPASAPQWAPTEDNILGPYYRQGAPFRGKITPPLSAGTVLVIRGRVWGHDTRKPLSGAVLDIWQADHQGRYDNDDRARPPKPDVFVNRARLITDDRGYYEFETVHPGRYKTGPDVWRPSHIHYGVQCKGYRSLVTQLYFKGDPMNASDPFVKPALIIELEEVTTDNGKYESGTFDIVLARGE